MNDRDNAYLRDMLDAAQEAIGFVQGLTFGAFETDRKLALALVQELAIIGEAAGRYPRRLPDPLLEYHGRKSSACGTG
jgi:uncharacterized protein with HEPN domain